MEKVTDTVSQKKCSVDLTTTPPSSAMLLDLARMGAPTEQRTLRLFGEIGPEASYAAWAALSQFQLESPNEEVIVYISSGGGSVTDAFSIWDALTSATCPITMIGVGEIMSAGAFIMYAGTPGKRFLAPNSVVMTHQMSYGDAGRMSAMRNRLHATEKMQERFITLMLDKCSLKGSKQSKLKKLQKYWLCEHDTYLFPQEAIEAIGLADHIGFPHTI